MGSTVLSEFYEKNEFVDYTKERINQEANIKFLYSIKYWRQIMFVNSRSSCSKWFYLLKGVTSPLLGIAINDALIFSTKSICLSYLDNGEAISHWWAGCAAGAAQDWKPYWWIFHIYLKFEISYVCWSIKRHWF